jgi:hypothetical protein
MTETRLVGGTAEDRAAIIKLHDAYIDVNARFDWENLEPIFSPSPDAAYFNLNGHTYNGRDHWIRLWKFYVTQVQSSYWTPYDIGGAVTGEIAVVWCHRRTRRKWVGPRHPLRRQRIRVALHHGVPQGRWSVAGGARAFLAGRQGAAAGRRLRVR